MAKNTEKARAHLEELQYLAAHDAITALPNRAGLLQLLEGTLAACDPAREAVVAVSLRMERFPETINVIGEEASDRLARHIAGALALHLDADELLRQLLDRSGLPPAQIVVELTESSFADDPQHLMRTAHALRSMGVRQSIDDFGTGYSSLAYLRDLPVDELKIDQVFIRSLAEGSRSAPLVEAVIRLAHTLGLEVVAEGIAEKAAEQFLAACGCDTGQGFLYAPAMPANLFIDYVRNSTAREPRLPAASRSEG